MTSADPNLAEKGLERLMREARHELVTPPLDGVPDDVASRFLPFETEQMPVKRPGRGVKSPILDGLAISALIGAQTPYKTMTEQWGRVRLQNIRDLGADNDTRNAPIRNRITILSPQYP